MYALVFIALFADDVEPKKTPVSAESPEIIKAQVKGDRLVARLQVYLHTIVKILRKTTVNGKEVVEEVTEHRPELHEKEFAWDLKKGTATTAGGKKLSLADLKKLLDKPQFVVISVDGKAVDPVYLKVLAADVIVIVAPMAAPDIQAPNEKPKPRD